MTSVFHSFVRLWSGFSMSYYAVRIGRRPGIYTSWAECEEQVKSFHKARYKKFSSQAEAINFIGQKASGSEPRSQPVPQAEPKSQYVFVQETSTGSVDHSDKIRDEGAFTSKPPASGPSSEQSGDATNLDPETPEATSPSDKPNTPSFVAPKLNNLLPKPSKTMLSSSRVLALKSTLSKISNLTQQLSTFVSQAEEQLENLQAGKKRAEKRAAPSSGGASASTGPAKPDKVRRAASPTQNDSPEVNADGGPVIDVWTDGCCHSNGRDDARAGIGVYWGPGDRFNVAEPLDGRATNNRAEIHAAIKAISVARARGIRNLRIHTDSKFVISCITEWIKTWKRNGWRNAKNQPVINREELEELDWELHQGDISVSWQHVAGHAGHEENEEADKLANAGARMGLHHSHY